MKNIATIFRQTSYECPPKLSEMLLIVRELEKQHKQHNSSFHFTEPAASSLRAPPTPSNEDGLTLQIYNSMEDFLNSSAAGQYPPSSARIKNFKNYDNIYKL